jgi:hypothetical protein
MHTYVRIGYTLQGSWRADGLEHSDSWTSRCWDKGTMGCGKGPDNGSIWGCGGGPSFCRRNVNDDLESLFFCTATLDTYFSQYTHHSHAHNGTKHTAVHTRTLKNSEVTPTTLNCTLNVTTRVITTNITIMPPTARSLPTHLTTGVDAIAPTEDT